MYKIDGKGTTLENIHLAAKAEFLEKGYKDASLRNIVKSVGMTTGAFYGYYKSKEELFEAIVGEHYEYILNRFIKAQEEFAQLPAARQPEVMSDISGICMYDILHYAYEHLEECKLILCCSEGTKFSGLIDEMVEIEADGTHAYQEVLRQLGRPSPKIDPRLEHILIHRSGTYGCLKFPADVINWIVFSKKSLLLCIYVKRAKLPHCTSLTAVSMR